MSENTENKEETKTTTTTEEKKEETTPSILGAGKPVFTFASVSQNSSTLSTSDSGDKDGENEKAEDQEPTIEFTPIIKVNKVETKTNEEDEEVLFEIRAKLFRFVTDPQPQWNERGLGVVKFLKHKTTKKIRIVMRRDQTFKVCLNHFVNPLLELKPGMGSDKSWVWSANDFAEEDHPEGILETLAIRFGSVEGANSFKENFEKFQKEMKALANPI
ncbi:Ran binding protein 1 domain-containing protein [Tieghemostelium lacteum]|uniref:Ran binding protein 1 domain-containing protein n=1 Tax=Tieghemostelium lacteum TaxID=361077 RepID=A0A152A2W7_TIELA|nr:Ran binding protein 1 domain-containing protein [Tieghemostelium lacteum]|eukprot:KYR00588.1 Ran binding protein 1 domain-containing protein [Tieghemostelium lacteum]